MADWKERGCLGFVGFCALAAIVLAVKSNDTPSAPAPVEIQVPRVTYSQEQVGRAQAIMGKARETAKIYEEPPHLVVECREYLYPYDINARLSWVRQVCDADAVLKGGEIRPIYFYDPARKQFAKADPQNGIRLLD